MSRPVFWSRDALDELIDIGRTIARDNLTAAQNVARKIRETGTNLGIRPIGRQGRVSGTYEKSVVNLPYILAYAINVVGGEERVTILRVIHSARNWTADTWPEK